MRAPIATPPQSQGKIRPNPLAVPKGPPAGFPVPSKGLPECHLGGHTSTSGLVNKQKLLPWQGHPYSYYSLSMSTSHYPQFIFNYFKGRDALLHTPRLSAASTGSRGTRLSTKMVSLPAGDRNSSLVQAGHTATTSVFRPSWHTPSTDWSSSDAQQVPSTATRQESSILTTQGAKRQRPTRRKTSPGPREGVAPRKEDLAGATPLHNGKPTPAQSSDTTGFRRQTPKPRSMGSWKGFPRAHEMTVYQWYNH